MKMVRKNNWIKFVAEDNIEFEIILLIEKAYTRNTKTAFMGWTE